MRPEDLNHIKVVVYEAMMPLQAEIECIKKEIALMNQKICGNGYEKRISMLENELRPLTILRWKIVGGFIVIANILTLATLVYKVLR